MSNQDNQIVFLLKTLKEKHVESTMTKGRFCFSHPSVFNKWERDNSAQYDRWDGHSAYEATHLVYAPIIEDNGDKIVYGEVKKLADRAIIHEQSATVKNTPICCFRYVQRDELIFDSGNSVDFTLGDTADRIKNEFGHDSFILINAANFLDRFRTKYKGLDGRVVYHDTLNDFEFNVDESIKSIVEQVFRKDKKYEWQKEYRFALQESTETPTFIELGSIEDIAITGELDYLKGTIRLRGEK